MRETAACRSSWRRRAESIPSFCATSAAKASRPSGVGHPADVREEVVEGLDLDLGGAGGELLAGAVDEVVGVALGSADGGHVGLHTVISRMKRSGSSPPSSEMTRTSKPSSVSRAMDFSAALMPAVSGSKLTMTLWVKRESRRTWASVKAVPEVARTLRTPAHVDGDAVHLAFDGRRRRVRDAASMDRRPPRAS